MKRKIIYTKSAVGNVFNDGIIELHEDLKRPEFKELKKKILDHEKSHDFKRGFFYNLQVEINEAVSTKELLKFMIKRPRTWIQILPIYWHKERGFIYDKNLLLFYGVIALWIFVLTKFIGGI